MMRRIYKYPLTITDRQVVALPQGSRILYLAEQYEVPVLYALVDVESINPLQDHVIRCFGTGQDVTLPIRWTPLGLVKLAGGQFMFHFFEEVIP